MNLRMSVIRAGGRGSRGGSDPESADHRTPGSRFGTLRHVVSLISVNLPNLVVNANDISLNFSRRKHGGGQGPFLIISRACGYALDVGFSPGPGSGKAGEVVLASAASGLVLAALPTRKSRDDWPVLVEAEKYSKWQRWHLEPSPDSAGHLLRLSGSALCLTMSADAKREWRPWLSPRDPQRSQQWMIVQPYGR
jgi:hypothetical protein